MQGKNVFLTVAAFFAAMAISCSDGGGSGGSEASDEREAVYVSTASDGYFDVEGGQYQRLRMAGTDETGAVLLSSSAAGAQNLSGSYRLDDGSRSILYLRDGERYVLVFDSVDGSSVYYALFSGALVTITKVRSDGTLVATYQGSRDTAAESGVESDPLDSEFRKIPYTAPFYMCDHEVTQAEFADIMGYNHSFFDNTGIKTRPGYSTQHDTAPTAGEIQSRRSVECVSFYEAVIYCNKLSMRKGLIPVYSMNGSTDPSAWGLPPGVYYNNILSDVSLDPWDGKLSMNAGADGYRLPTREEIDYLQRFRTDEGWFVDNSGGKTHEVKQSKPDVFLLYDMHGNVEEWYWRPSASGGYECGANGGNWSEARTHLGSWAGAYNDGMAETGFRVCRTAR